MGDLLDRVFEKEGHLYGQPSEGGEVLLRPKPTLGILVVQIDIGEVIKDSLTKKGINKKELEEKLYRDYEASKLDVLNNSDGLILFGPCSGVGIHTIAQPYAIYYE